MHKIDFKDAAIVCSKNFKDKCEYDAANYKSMIQFDGCGNISRYSVANKWDMVTPQSWYSGISINGRPLDIEVPKNVTMIGKNQTVEIRNSDVNIKIEQFIDEITNAVFCEYYFENKCDSPSEIQINFGYQVEYNGYAISKISDNEQLLTPRKSIKVESKGVFMDVTDDYYFDIAFNKETNVNEIRDDVLFYYNFKTKIEGHKSDKFRMVISGGNRKDSSYCNVKTLVDCFDDHYSKSLFYIEKLRALIKSSDEKLKAMFVSCINCSLSSYKEVEENGFKGFFAGINYQKPARTYYRDGYWTILSVLPFFPELVKNEIISLAKGVHENGMCPSAVIYSNEIKDFWSDHYDSPLFFIMMVYDYICFSGDFELLTKDINGMKIIELMEACIKRFIDGSKEKILISKPEYCRRDWVDNVYRSGYTTYIEVLYCRALYCIGSIFSKTDEDKSSAYFELFKKCKADINKYLWNEEKGYYNNYRDEGRIEDNLSIDTVISVLYDVADDDKKKRIIDNCEAMLETINNKEQKYNDWGVMCVYPFYKHKNDLVEKSNFEYRYHNGSDWPYLDGLYAMVKMRNNRSFDYALNRWFDYSMEKEWFTPVEYYDPIYGKGSNLQAWSSMPAAAIVMGGFNLMPDINGNANIVNKGLKCTLSNVKLWNKTIELV